MLFCLTFYSSKNQGIKYHWFQKKKKYIYIYICMYVFSSTTVLTLIINQHIRMISEGSHDTEDWSNDAENSALRHRNKLCLKVY